MTNPTHGRYDLSPFTVAASAVNQLEEDRKGTGRTTAALMSLKPGDRFIVPFSHMVKRSLEWLETNGVKDVEVVYVQPGLQSLELMTTSRGKTVFDHTWVEACLKTELGHVASQLGLLADRISGFDERHERTRDFYRNLTEPVQYGGIHGAV